MKFARKYCSSQQHIHIHFFCYLWPDPSFYLWRKIDRRRRLLCFLCRRLIHSPLIFASQREEGKRRKAGGNKHIKLFAVIRLRRRRRDERGEKEGKYDFMEYLIPTSHPNLHCSAFLCLKANETSVEPCCVHKSPPLSNRKTELLCLDCQETSFGYTFVQHFMKPGLDDIRWPHRRSIRLSLLRGRSKLTSFSPAHTTSHDG